MNVLEPFLFPLLVSLALLSAVRSLTPSAYAFAARLLRFSFSLTLWLVRGSMSWPTAADRRRQRGAERFVPKRSKGR